MAVILFLTQYTTQSAKRGNSGAGTELQNLHQGFSENTNP